METQYLQFCNLSFLKTQTTMLSLFKLKSSVMHQPQKHAYAILWILAITVCFYDLSCMKSPNSYFGQNIFLCCY